VAVEFGSEILQKYGSSAWVCDAAFDNAGNLSLLVHYCDAQWARRAVVARYNYKLGTGPDENPVSNEMTHVNAHGQVAGLYHPPKSSLPNPESAGWAVPEIAGRRYFRNNYPTWSIAKVVGSISEFTNRGAASGRMTTDLYGMEWYPQDPWPSFYLVAGNVDAPNLEYVIDSGGSLRTYEDSDYPEEDKDFEPIFVESGRIRRKFGQDAKVNGISETGQVLYYPRLRQRHPVREGKWIVGRDLLLSDPWSELGKSLGDRDLVILGDGTVFGVSPAAVPQVEQQEPEMVMPSKFMYGYVRSAPGEAQEDWRRRLPRPLRNQIAPCWRQENISETGEKIASTRFAISSTGLNREMLFHGSEYRGMRDSRGQPVWESGMFFVDLKEGRSKGIWRAKLPFGVSEVKPRRGINSDHCMLGLRSGGAPVLLLPVEVTVRKKSEADSPPTGLVVKKGEVVTFDINGPAPASDFPLPANTVKWKTKQLKSDGTYTDWAEIPGDGPELEFTTNTSGIFQVKAVLAVPGGQPQDLLLVRKKDELKTGNGYMGPGRKGQPDAFGVCDTQKQVDIQVEAKRYLGSTAYEANTPVPAEYGFGAYPASGNSIIRCNIFVAHRCCAVGASVPAINFGLGITTGNPGVNAYPPRANQWAGIETTAPFTIGTTYIAGWDLQAPNTYPQPGFIIAHPNPQPGDAGHCAIIDYDGGGVGAGISGTVNKNYTEFYDGTSRFRFYRP
jgi:hypothetical protein